MTAKVRHDSEGAATIAPNTNANADASTITATVDTTTQANTTTAPTPANNAFRKKKDVKRQLGVFVCSESTAAAVAKHASAEIVEVPWTAPNRRRCRRHRQPRSRSSQNTGKSRKPLTTWHGRSTRTGFHEKMWLTRSLVER